MVGFLGNSLLRNFYSFKPEHKYHKLESSDAYPNFYSHIEAFTTLEYRRVSSY